MKEFLIVFVLVIGTLAVFIGGTAYAMSYLEEWRCRVSWADSGMQSRWSWGAGCQLSRDGAHWIPSSRYREVSQ